MADKVEWIKMNKGYFDEPVCRILGSKNPLYLLVYTKMILKSVQVENENYGYISTKIGNYSFDVKDSGFLWDIDNETMTKCSAELVRFQVIEVQKDRIKVNYPWKSDPTRSSAEYYHWKNEVRKRDNFKCCECGNDVDVVVHHKIPWKICKDDDELRYDIDNGITLCRKCHLDAHQGNWRN